MVRAAGEEAEQGGTTEVQRRGGDAEKAATSKHREVLQLLGVHGDQKEEHRARHGAHAERNLENVSRNFRFLY